MEELQRHLKPVEDIPQEFVFITLSKLATSYGTATWAACFGAGFFEQWEKGFSCWNMGGLQGYGFHIFCCLGAVGSGGFVP